jgi:hypothetical protein
MRGDAESDVIETRVGPDGSVKFLRRVYDIRVPFTPCDVYATELDPSPARRGDDAGRFGGWEVAAQRFLIGGDDLGGDVPGEPKYKVAHPFHRFGPAAPEDDRGGAD